jgi:photosystem II stability/assembly factor-like uncharacterized protein
LGDVRPVTAIHRTGAAQLYVGAEDGLFRWEPERKTWQPLSLPLVAPTVFVVVSDARDAGAVYAGATDGLWRSPDGGKSWIRWGKGLEGKTVTALAISPADQRMAFADRAIWDCTDRGSRSNRSQPGKTVWRLHRCGITCSAEMARQSM